MRLLACVILLWLILGHVANINRTLTRLAQSTVEVKR